MQYNKQFKQKKQFNVATVNSLKGYKSVNFKNNLKVQSEDDEEEISNQQSLGYFMKSSVQNQYIVDIDEPFVYPAYYRNIVQMLLSASEDDIVIFRYNSPGGREDSLLTLIDAVQNTEAHTIGVIVGECSSAASMLVMYMNTVVVAENARMLCHVASFGVGGKSPDVLAHVRHTSKIVDKLIRNTYHEFLSEEEIDDLLEGREIYLDADEIKERLALREDSLDESEQGCNQCENEGVTEVPPPVKPKKTKATT